MSGVGPLASGSVARPLGGTNTLYHCLTCSYFRATATRPTLTIVCQAPTPA